MSHGILWGLLLNRAQLYGRFFPVPCKIDEESFMLLDKEMGWRGHAHLLLLTWSYLQWQEHSVRFLCSGGNTNADVCCKRMIAFKMMLAYSSTWNFFGGMQDWFLIKERIIDLILYGSSIEGFFRVRVLRCKSAFDVWDAVFLGNLDILLLLFVIPCLGSVLYLL